MPTASLQTEDIVFALYETLQADLTDALTGVAARRNAERPPWAMALPVPAQITIGFNELLLDMQPNALPVVSVIGAPRQRANERDDNARVAQAIHTALIEWVVLHTERTRATLLAFRYGEAILDALHARNVFAGWHIDTAAPDVAEGQATPFTLDPLQRASKGFIAGGSLSLPLRGKYVL